MENISGYLSKQATQREAGLIVAAGPAADTAITALGKHGYVAASDFDGLLRLLMQGKKVYWHYIGGDFQLLYSFLAQYPNGMVELFDASSGATYRGQELESGFILVTSAEQVQRADSRGYDLLGRVGLTIKA